LDGKLACASEKKSHGSLIVEAEASDASEGTIIERECAWCCCPKIPQTSFARQTRIMPGCDICRPSGIGIRVFSGVQIRTILHSAADILLCGTSVSAYEG
jgi:hypothetical protein